MPTKPADNPEQWAIDGNYPASNYPAEYPWGESHPNPGAPTPWSGNPRLDTVGLQAFANKGSVPLEGQSAELFNEEYRRVVELSRWTFLGTSSADQDAHIVETDSNGTAAVYGLQAGGPSVQLEVAPALGTIEFKNAAAVEFGASLTSWTANIATTFNQQITSNGAAIQMNEGANLADGKSIIGGNATNIVAELIVAIDRLQLGLNGTSVASGQLTRDANSKLLYRESATDAFVDSSAKGRSKSTGVAEDPTGLLATVLVPTAGKVTPEAAAKVSITAVFQAQRAGAGGTITTQLQQDQGTGTWVDVGTTQQDTIVGNGSATIWSTVTMSRDYAAPDTTAREYRIRVTGGATNQLRSARIRAEVTEN